MSSTSICSHAPDYGRQNRDWMGRTWKGGKGYRNGIGGIGRKVSRRRWENAVYLGYNNKSL